MKIDDPSQRRLMEDLNSRNFGGAAGACLGVILASAGVDETCLSVVLTTIGAAETRLGVILAVVGVAET